MALLQRTWLAKSTSIPLRTNRVSIGATITVCLWGMMSMCIAGLSERRCKIGGVCLNSSGLEVHIRADFKSDFVTIRFVI